MALSDSVCSGGNMEIDRNKICGSGVPGAAAVPVPSWLGTRCQSGGNGAQQINTEYLQHV